MPALFFALGRWDGNIGRESAALIESSLLSAALVPGRAIHPMGGDAHDRFHRAREAPDRYGLAPHGPCRPFQGTQAGLEAQRRYEKAIGAASPAAQLLSAGSGCHNGL